MRIIVSPPGQAGPANIMRDFSGAPQAKTCFPVTLANAISGSDLTPGQPHITAEFSSSFANRYFGTDGATPANNYALMSVVLHELGHGLGFMGSADVNAGQRSWDSGSGFPFIYDRFIENTHGQQILDTSLFPNPSAALAGQLPSSRLFFNGARAQPTETGPHPFTRLSTGRRVRVFPIWMK